MFLSEPPPSQADLHFRLFGIPVRVHPFFWLSVLFLKMGGSGKANPQDVLIWICVVFVSIIVHEMGHAITQQFFGGHPWITLYGFGGLASCGDCDRRPSRQILISLAGPLAGFLLAGAIIAALYAVGRLAFFPGDWLPSIAVSLTNPIAQRVVLYAIFVNVVWGLINLLPIFPLDGGQVSRQLFVLWNSQTGTLYSLYLSFAAAMLVTAYSVLRSDLYLAVMFGFMAYGNYQAIQSIRNYWR